MQRFLGPLFSSPVFRRVGWHLARVRGAVDRRFFGQLLFGAFVLVLIAASLITLVEKPLTFGSLGASLNWGVQTILGQGDSSYVTSPGGYVIGWLLAFFGVAIVATLTAAIVGFVIDFLLKEGQGMVELERLKTLSEELPAALSCEASSVTTVSSDTK